MTASRGMCMMQMHYFHEISRQVASIHRASEKAHSRKLTVAKSRPIPRVAECMSAYMDRIRPRTGVHGSICCVNLLRGATGCCNRIAGEFVLCSVLCSEDELHRTKCSCRLAR